MKQLLIELPAYDFGMSGLMLTFRADSSRAQMLLGGDTLYEAAAQETTQETTQEKILSFLRIRPGATRRELANALHLSDSGIKYHLQKLKDAGIIRHVGADKAGHWEILK